MEFIGTFLAKSGLSASNINNQTRGQPRPDVEAENNDMLRLHLNLSESLNKSTEKTQEKISLFYVTIITIVSNNCFIEGENQNIKYFIFRFSPFSPSISLNGMTTDCK